MAETTQFSYKAKSKTGKFFEGNTRAISEAAVTDFLVSKGLIPLEVKPVSGLNMNISFGTPRVKPKDVAVFMRSFATMTGAGISITRSLEVMKNQQSNPTFKMALTKIAQDIDTGSTFANAINKHPTIFTPLTIAMIRAGEAGGFLTGVLLQVATNLDADIKLKAKIKSAMTYPVAIFILAILIVIGMLLFIVPVFAKLFSGLGGHLPFATQVLVTLSDGLKILAIPIAIVSIFGTIWWRKNSYRPKIREFVDPIKLKIPIFGTLSKKLIAARFARNFGSLLDAGLPVMQVLDIVGSTSGSTVVEKALEDVKYHVSTGELIAPQLRTHSIFPSMLVEMMAVGEDAGEIPEMMMKIAESYDTEVETMTDALASLIEPIMLVFLGVLVGGVVVALYMPIFSIYDLVKK